jgi:hypothetical protein
MDANVNSSYKNLSPELVPDHETEPNPEIDCSCGLSQDARFQKCG